MSTDLSPQNESYIQEAVARGAFPSRGQALDAAVELLRERDARRDEWIREVQAGIDQIERGEYAPLDIDDIKARGRERLAARGKLP